MADHVIVWADLAQEAYGTLPTERRTLVDLRLTQLAANPTADAAFDSTRGWGSTSYAHGSGLLIYAISARHRRVVLIRLVDLA